MPAHEQSLREAWEAVLAMPVTDDTDFFASGGHSLLAVELSMAVEERLGIEPPPDLVYRFRTFRDYAVAPEFGRSAQDEKCR